MLFKSIRIGDLTFEVLPFDKGGVEDRTKYGHYDLQTQEIRFTPGCTDEHMVNIMIHEVMHGCYKHACLEDGDEEERVVRSMANVFAEVLRSNPEFSKWLESTLKRIRK